jgi:hypothetical protein
MTIPTPEDRLHAVESNAYTIQGIAEALAAISGFAHLTDRADIGFMVGFMADRLREESDTIILAATDRSRGMTR